MKKLIAISFLFLFAVVSMAQTIFYDGFEEWEGGLPTSWIGLRNNFSTDSIFQQTDDVYSGNFCVKLQNREVVAQRFTSKSVSIVEGEQYLFFFMIKGKGTIQDVKIFPQNSVSPFQNLFTVNNIESNEWTGFETTFTSNYTSETAEISFNIKSTNAEFGDLQIDDVYLIKIDNQNFSNQEFIDINNIKACINAGGSLFNTLGAGASGFEVPNESGNHTIYISNIWLAGVDQNSELHAAYQKYGGMTGEDVDFYYGPVANNYYLSDYILKYKRVWKINKTEIDYHISNFSLPEYEIPEAILNWPGNGNTSNGEMQIIAPFVDVNSNNIYEPNMGDYPVIRGDQAIFFIFNDDKKNHDSGGEKLKLEIHGLAYAYDAPTDSALSQTVFLNYNIYNRSENNYNNVYFGSFSDMDLGSGSDDYIGCDSLLNMYYTYNSTNNDANYGEAPPAQGAVFLNQPISKFVYYINDSELMGDPTTPNEVYNYLTGLWKDGTPMTYGGNGYGGVVPTNYMFSGAPENSEGWTEVSEATVGGDRRGVMSVGPFDFNSGEMLCVDLAFPFARDYIGSNLTSISLLRNRVSQIQSHYNSQGYECEMPELTNIQPTINNNFIQIFPNPTNDFIDIISQREIISVQIANITGQVVYTQNPYSQNIKLSVNNYAAGIYFVKVYTQNEVTTHKIIVE